MNLDLSKLCRVAAVAVFTSQFLLPSSSFAQRSATGALSGVVVNEAGTPVAAATIRVARADGSDPHETTADTTGKFTIASLPSGLYQVSARRIGYRVAVLPSFRIVDGQPSSIRVILTA